MSSLVPIVKLPYLPPNTVVPKPSDDEDTFVQYLMRVYEDIAFALNARDFVFFPIAISDTATNIPNMETFGSYIICVSGVQSTLPVKTYSLVKADATAAGVINILGTQAGTGTWAGNNIIVTSTATNFQIRHDRAGVVGNFNIRIIGTQ